MTATDISPTIIRRLAQAQRAAGPAAVEYAVADCRCTGLASESFDMVLDKATCDALMGGADPQRAVCALAREAARLLRPNGHLVVVTHYQADDPEAEDYMHAGPLLAAILEGLIAGAPAAAWTAEVHAPDPDDCPRVIIFRKQLADRATRGRPLPRTSGDVTLRVVVP